MAQSSQATPTVQANLGGSSTTVNLRDWLNTRLSPFLKRAIIESLDAEAQYPLQWLGEQLILQSIQFEGNPDSTNIRERFLYKHEIDPKNTQTGPAGPVGSAEPSEGAAGPQQQIVSTSDSPPVATSAAQSEAQPPAEPSQPAVSGLPTADTEQGDPPATTVNGTVQPSNVDQSQDTEMSNAP